MKPQNDRDALAEYFPRGRPLPTLAKGLSALFAARKPKKARESAATRKAREYAKPTAAEYEVEIERIDGGFNVWPPASIADTPRDPFEGDHFADDWQGVARMVRAYAAIVDGENPYRDGTRSAALWNATHAPEA